MEIEQKIGRNRIIITEPYTERVRFIRREMFASYTLKLKPNSSNTISIAHDGTVDHRRVGIPYYLPKYIQNFQKLDISISGMELELTNHEVNALDSKPLAYDASIFLSLKAWVERGSTKYVVVEPKLKSNNYEFKKTDDRIQYLNKIYNEHKLDDNRLYNDITLSILNDQKLILTESNLNIKIQNKYDLEFEFRNKRRNTNINLYFTKDKFSPHETSSIKTVIKKVIKSTYDNGVNLRGFDIFFSKKDESNNIEDGTVTNLEWAIRNLLANEESIFQIDETSR